MRISAEVDALALGAIVAGSAHGLTDLLRPPRELAAYALLLVPIPAFAVTPAFLCCSLLHFARDVGWWCSAALHLSFAGLERARGGLGWSAFAAYYYVVHVPRHCLRHGLRLRGAQLTLAAFAIATGAPASARVTLTHPMQLAVVAHVLTDELHGASQVRAT